MRICDWQSAILTLHKRSYPQFHNACGSGFSATRTRLRTSPRPPNGGGSTRKWLAQHSSSQENQRGKAATPFRPRFLATMKRDTHHARPSNQAQQLLGSIPTTITPAALLAGPNHTTNSDEISTAFFFRVNFNCSRLPIACHYAKGARLAEETHRAGRADSNRGRRAAPPLLPLRPRSLSPQQLLPAYLVPPGAELRVVERGGIGGGEGTGGCLVPAGSSLPRGS